MIEHNVSSFTLVAYWCSIPTMSWKEFCGYATWGEEKEGKNKHPKVLVFGHLCSSFFFSCFVSKEVDWFTNSIILLCGADLCYTLGGTQWAEYSITYPTNAQKTPLLYVDLPEPAWTKIKIRKAICGQLSARRETRKFAGRKQVFNPSTSRGTWCACGCIGSWKWIFQIPFHCRSDQNHYQEDPGHKSISS